MLSFFFIVRCEVFNDDLIVVDVYKWCKNSIGVLSDEEEKFSVCGGKFDNFVEVYDEVSELNSGV